MDRRCYRDSHFRFFRKIDSAVFRNRRISLGAQMFFGKVQELIPEPLDGFVDGTPMALSGAAPYSPKSYGQVSVSPLTT